MFEPLIFTLPWPPADLSPNAARSKKGWLIPNPETDLSDAKEVRRLYLYDPETGVFLRRITIGQRAKRGTVAGFTCHGRRRIYFRGKAVFASRLAWLYMTGEWPRGVIDHVNGNTLDDRMANLRDVDASINMENQRNARIDNRSGLLGVRKNRAGSYSARIWFKGRPQTIGAFPTAEEAHAAYLERKRAIHEGCTL